MKYYMLSYNWPIFSLRVCCFFLVMFWLWRLIIVIVVVSPNFRWENIVTISYKTLTWLHLFWLMVIYNVIPENHKWHSIIVVGNMWFCLFHYGNQICWYVVCVTLYEFISSSMHNIHKHDYFSVTVDKFTKIAQQISPGAHFTNMV